MKHCLCMFAVMMMLVSSHAFAATDKNVQQKESSNLSRFRFMPMPVTSRFSEAGLPSQASPASELLLYDYFRTQNAGAPETFLTARPEQLYGLERFELSRTMSTLQGAGLGANAGMFLGALGSAFGAFDEKTAYWLMGAGAAAGALWGGTKAYEDPGWRIRYRWTEDDPIKSQ